MPKIVYRNELCQIKKPGFSLSETLFVLVLASILLGMVSLNFDKLLIRNRLNSAAKELVLHLKKLRIQSIVENRTWQARIEQGIFMYRRKTGLEWEDWNKLTLRRDLLYELNNDLYFSGNGFVSPKTLLIREGLYQYKLIININGRIRLESNF